MKLRFYTVTTRVLTSRRRSAPSKSVGDSLVEPFREYECFQYRADDETRRRKQLDTVFRCTNDQIAEERRLLKDLTSVEIAIKKLESTIARGAIARGGRPGWMNVQLGPQIPGASLVTAGGALWGGGHARSGAGGGAGTGAADHDGMEIDAPETESPLPGSAVVADALAIRNAASRSRPPFAHAAGTGGVRRAPPLASAVGQSSGGAGQAPGAALSASAELRNDPFLGISLRSACAVAPIPGESLDGASSRRVNEVLSQLHIASLSVPTEGAVEAFRALRLETATMLSLSKVVERAEQRVYKLERLRKEGTLPIHTYTPQEMQAMHAAPSHGGASHGRASAQPAAGRASMPPPPQRAARPAEPRAAAAAQQQTVSFSPLPHEVGAEGGEASAGGGAAARAGVTAPPRHAPQPPPPPPPPVITAPPSHSAPAPPPSHETLQPAPVAASSEQGHRVAPAAAQAVAAAEAAEDSPGPSSRVSYDAGGAAAAARKRRAPDADMAGSEGDGAGQREAVRKSHKKRAAGEH